MEFEVSFRETLRQLADAQVRLNDVGKVLDDNTDKSSKMASAMSTAAAKIRREMSQLEKHIDRNNLLREDEKNHIENTRKAAERLFVAMAKGNLDATAKLQAFNGELGNLDRLVKDTASKQAYTRWLQRSSTLHAEAAGKTQFHITQLDHLSTAEGRAAVAAATLTQERVKSIRESTKAAAAAAEARSNLDSHVQAYQRFIQAQKAARESSNAYLAIINQLTNAEREMAVTGQKVAWGYERLTTRAAELTAQQNAAKAAIDQSNRAMIEGAANIERYTGANADALQMVRTRHQVEDQAALARKRQLAELRSAIEARYAAEDKSHKLVDRLTRSEAEYQQRLGRVNAAITARNNLRQAEAAAANTVSSSEAKLTQRIKEQTAEYQRRAQYMQMTNAQLLGLSRSHDRISRDMHLNAQAAAMFRAGLGGLNASIGIYTSATVIAASATYAIATAFRTGMSSGMEFTETMARAEAVMMTSSTAVTNAGRSMEAVTAQVRALGASTLYTSTEVAGGLVDLGMAGLSASDAMTSLAPALNLAAIGSIDMSRSADIATNVMTSFDKTAGELGNVVDIMATAITNSNTNIEQLSNALSYVGPAAQAAGFELEDTTAVIELLSNAGIKASRAGTGLRRFMLNIQNPTAKGAAVLDRFGISIVNAEGQTRSMTDILGQFNRALHNDAITPAERTAAIMDLVGVRAQSAVARMISSFDQFGVLRRQLDEVSGAAERMRETMEDVLSMDWRQLKSAFQDIQLDTFLKYEDTLRSFTAQARLSLMELQSVNQEMTSLVFSPEQIADGKVVTELDILVTKVGEAIDVVKGLGIAFGTWKAASVASTMTAALSKNLWNFGERMETVNSRVKVYERYQRMANAQTLAAGKTVSVYGKAAHLGAQGTNAFTRELYLNSQALSMVGRAASVAMAALGWAGVVYGLYTAVTTLFSNDTAERIRNHGNSVEEAKERYKSLQEAISKTTEARQLAALNLRASEAEEEAEGLRRRIELTERALDQMDEQSSAYQRTTDDLFRYNEALAEAEKQAKEAREAASQVGVNEAQVEGMRERMAMLRESIATTADSIDRYKETSESLADQAAFTRAADGGLELARAHEIAANKANILTGFLAALKAQVEGLTDATNEAERAASNHGEAMASALNAQTARITAEYDFEQLSDFEKMKQMEAERNVILASSIRLSKEGIALNEEGVDVMLRWTDQALEANEASLEHAQTVAETWQKVADKQRELEALQLNEIDTLESLRLKMNEVQAARIAMYAVSAVTGENVDPANELKLLEQLTDLQTRLNTLNNRNTKGSRSSSRSANQELEQMLRTFQQLRQEYDPVTSATAEYNKQLSEMDQLLKLGKISTDDHAAAKAHLTDEYKKSINPLTEIRDILDPVGQLTEEYEERVEALNAAVALGTITWLEAAEAQMIYAAELGKGKDALDPYAKRTKELLDQYGKVDDIVKTRKAVSDLNERLRDESLPDDVRRNLVRAKEAAEKELQELVYQSDDAAQEIRRSWDRAMEGIDTSFVDGIEGMLDKSKNVFENFSDAMIDGTKRMVAEMIYQAALKPVVVQITTAMGSKLGIPGVGGAQQAGIMSPQSLNPGMIKTGWDAVSGWFTGTPSATSVAAGGVYNNVAGNGYTGALGNATSKGATLGGNAMSGLYTAGAGMAGGYAGTQIGSSVFGKEAGSSYGATAGSLAGAYLGTSIGSLGGPIGAALGGALGGLADSIFGRSKKSFDFDFVQGAQPGVFGDRSSALGDFGIAKFSDYKLGEQQDALQALMDQIANFDNTLANAAIDERVDAMRASIEGFTHSGPEDLFDTRLRAIVDGSGVLIESAIAQIADPQQLADALLSVLNIERVMQSLNGQIQSDVAAHLEANTGNIQGTAASLTQAINATVLLGNSAKQLNLQFDDTAGGAIHYAWAMQEAVGGLDALNNMSASYYQNYFTAAEREAMHREDLTRAMQELGFELPKSRDGFRELMEAQNLNTTAGVQNAAALMQLEGAFAQLTPAITDAGAAAKSASDILKEKAQLERELLRAQGATDALRKLELAGIDESNQSLQERIWAIEDEKEAEAERERQRQIAIRAAEQEARAIEQVIAARQREIESAEQAVQQAYQQFDQQQFGMQIELLELMGDGEKVLALQRERELKTIDESLRPFKKRLWALQDEAAAQEKARQASQEYAAELINIRGQLSGSLDSISQWMDQRNATSGTPTMNLKEAGEQFARQLVLAENGDRDALQNITQYADRYLAAGESMYASGSGFQRIQEDVLASLKGLPEALSDAEFIVEGFRGIVSNEMAKQIEIAIFNSQYKIDTLIEFAADASALPQDLRTILGEQAHRLDSTLNYLLGENQLDNDLRRLALESTNNLVSTVDYITGYTLSESDKLLALSSSNTMTAVIDYVIGSDLDHGSRLLALESSNTYSAMIDMILGRDVSEDDRRLALGSANRYASLIDYVIRSDIDEGSRRIALSSLNEYDVLIDYATRKDVTSADRKLALTSGNKYLSTLDYIVGRDIDEGSRTLALDSNHQYLSTINYILGKQLSPDNKRLALDTANRFNASVRYITEAEITGDDRRLALSAGQTFDALVKYFSDNRLTKDERKLALSSANRYVTTMDYIRGLDIDATSKALAMGASNRYISTVNIVLGSNISSTYRKLALNSANRYDAVVKYTVDSPITGDNRRLALNSGHKYEALIGYYVNRDVSKTDRELALASGNRYLANIEYLVGKDISSNDRKLALNSNNKYVSTIDHLIGKKITGDDRRLALSSTNRYLTTVDAVLARGIPSDVRTFGLASSNAIMTTVNGILASKMSGDVRTLALKNSNQFVTTLEAALKDGRITGDERKLLDAKSASVIKTLKTSGSLNLSDDEWAVINAASGSKRLELLADVAFGRTDLDHLKDIDENTKPLAERANNQLTKLTGLVREMAKSTGELVDLNGSMVSLSKAIAQLKTVMSSRASDTSVRNAAKDTVGKLGSVEGKANSSAISNRAIANFFDKAGNPNWGLRVSMSYHQDSSAVRSFGYHAAKEMRSEFNASGLRIAVGWGHSRDGAEALARVFKNIMGANVNGSHFNGLERVPFDGYVAELHKDETVLTAAQANALRGLSKGGYRGSQPSVTRGINPMPLPNFPLLGKSDVAELLRDLKREVVELRKEQARLQAENNKHLQAANNQRGAATKAQIEAIEKGNKMFKRMEEDKRMEVAKR